MFEKDNNLMSGKGEWDEAEHPREPDGKFAPKGGGADLSNSKNQQGLLSEVKKDQEQPGKTNQISITKEKLKELVNDILNFEPIELKINDRTIVAQFDKYSANKNIYGRWNSNHEGYLFKLENIKNLPQYIESSTYSHSKPESGKDSRQHKGVKEWHYFINQIHTDKGVFDIAVNVRDKGSNQFIYEVSFKKKKGLRPD